MHLRTSLLAVALLLAFACAHAVESLPGDGTAVLIEEREQLKFELPSDDGSHLFLELEALARDLELSEDELKSIVGDVVDRVKNTCNGWINDMRNALTSSVNSIRSASESTMNGLVTTLNNDVTSYVRTAFVAPFQSFSGKLDIARNEVQGAISSVADKALSAKNTMESFLVTIANRIMNPLGVPDSVECTPPDFMTGTNIGDGARQSWCKMSWAMNKLGVGSFFDKTGSLVSRHSDQGGSSFMEMHAQAIARAGAGGESAATSTANKLTQNQCKAYKAAAVVLDGLDKSCNMILAALDTESVTQWNILTLTSTFKLVSIIFKEQCAENGY